MSEIDELITQGKDPLDAIWVKATAQMERDDLDRRLSEYIKKMPPELQKRLRELIDERVKKALR